MRMRIAVSVAASLAGCGAPPLERDDVVGIPPGTATGAGASGVYMTSVRTIECCGRCSQFTCIAGYGGETVTLSQVDGSLMFDIGDFSVVGGIDVDGAFRVGDMYAYRDIVDSFKEFGLIEGTLTGGHLSGVFKDRIVGTHAGRRVDCTVAAELTGDRVP